jgi:haloalkane dehalogenase
MEFVRTPNNRFTNLDGYPFEPNYVSIADGEGGELRMHYLDEGPADGEIVLCLHGQPTWSYLYRKMIPVLVAGGYRVIAPDIVGFGKSDKPTLRENYTYASHVAWMNNFVNRLDLNGITLVCQDWGGLIGLRVVTAQPDRFARVVTANTGLPDASGIPDEMAAAMHQMYDSIPALPPLEMGAKLQENEHGAGFMYWIKFCAEYPEFIISEVVSMSAMGELSKAQIAAYDAPFPDESFKAGARQFPSLVPIFPDGPEIPANRDAWEVLKGFNKPFLTAFSDRDPVTAGGYKRFQKDVPGAQNQKHVTIEGAGHFLQEDKGEELANVVINFIQDNPA